MNRLSIGAQSFDPDKLAVLGRVHGVGEIGLAVREAVAAGFEDVNIDLMYALPGQDVAGALAAGLQAILVERPGLPPREVPPQASGAPRVPDLVEVARRLGVDLA